MELIKGISTRRSIRKYKDLPIDREILKEILTAAIYAPSAHNSQPWHFIILSDEAVKSDLALKMAERYREDLERDGVPAPQIDNLINHSIQAFTSPPLLVLACLTNERVDRYPDHRKQAERTMMIQSVSAAIQNLLLAAHAKSLATCWYCAPLFCPNVVRNCLKIPDHIEPLALITLGYGNEDPSPPLRSPLPEVLHENSWRTSF